MVKMLKRLILILVLALAPVSATADVTDIRDRIVHVLREDGYSEIRMSRTLLGRLRFVGTRSDAQREIGLFRAGQGQNGAVAGAGQLGHFAFRVLQIGAQLHRPGVLAFQPGHQGFDGMGQIGVLRRGLVRHLGETFQRGDGKAPAMSAMMANYL